MQRRGASVDDAVRLLEGVRRIDVRPLLSRITAPTLVVHGKRDKAVPYDRGRELAAGIRNARLVSIEGGHDAGGSGSEASEFLYDVTREFLADVLGDVPTSTPPSPRRNRPKTPGMVVVLFTDLVDHTEMMRRLGDMKGRDVLREHERITRETLKAHGGAEVKTMGDGFMASFGSVTKAMDCAIALQRAFADHAESMPEPLRVRVGLNAGEPIEEDGDLFGSTVILASRIAARAGAGEILVPDTVRGLLSGKGFMFADRGEFVPKGFEDAVRLYEVRWRPEGVAAGDD